MKKKATHSFEREEGSPIYWHIQSPSRSEKKTERETDRRNLRSSNAAAHDKKQKKEGTRRFLLNLSLSLLCHLYLICNLHLHTFLNLFFFLLLGMWLFFLLLLFMLCHLYF
jgi:hypothetical protein